MKHIKSERGQSLVELAISLVILIYLLAGAVEFGLAFFQFVQLRDAAQEGALYGSVFPSDTSGIIARIQGASSSPINLSGGDVTITISIDGIPSTDTTNYANVDCEGHGLEVEVLYPHQVFMPFMSEFIGSTIDLNANVTDTILSPVDCTP
ncbi:MAG: TadE/TadG family type IV pilus assembly protein [Anaerolineales bacterium]